MSARGRYIALEGWEGSGKSTQAKLLAQRVAALETREPGVTPLGAHLRDLLLFSHLWPSPRAEALLFAADRAQHISEVVAPALAAGRNVVTDRSYGSTLAYQGYGRDLPLDELRALTEFASRRPDPPPSGSELPAVLLPDVVVLLELPLETSQERMDPKSKRGGRKKKVDGLQMPLFQPGASGPSSTGRDDKFEQQDHLFRERVWRGFDELCDAEPERWVRVDAAGSVNEVAELVWAAVAEHPAMAG